MGTYTVTELFLAVLLTCLGTGLAAWLGVVRGSVRKSEFDKHRKEFSELREVVLTKDGHDEICVLKGALHEKDIEHITDWLKRVERKLDVVIRYANGNNQRKREEASG